MLVHLDKVGVKLLLEPLPHLSKPIGRLATRLLSPVPTTGEAPPASYALASWFGGSAQRRAKDKETGEDGTERTVGFRQATV